jgi:hypothetical protein
VLNPAVASSYTSNAWCGSPVSTMSQRSTFGQSAGSCRATVRLAAEVMTTRAWQSLTMYATSSGAKYELTHV